MRERTAGRLDRRRFVVGAGALTLAGVPGRTRLAAAKPEHGTGGARGAEFFARPTGSRGELIAYSLESGVPLFTLPAGLLSPNGTHFVTVARDPVGLDAIWLYRYDPATRAQTFRRRYVGNWALGGISANGRWGALTSIPSDADQAAWTKENTWQTEVMLVDFESDGPPRRETLDGRFEVEVVSADGDALFLIEHLPAANPDRYLVRLYDNAQGGLQPGALRDKKTQDEFMAGLAWDGIASADGQWMLTLYLSTTREVAFVHALNLHQRYPVCIDLPSGDGSFDLLKQYSLVLAPDSRRLFAANTALGVVADVDLTEMQVVRDATFAPASDAASASFGSVSRAALRPDGSALYFGSAHDVWAYDVAKQTVSAPMTIPGPIIGLGIGPDERHVLVARPDEPLLILDPTSGASVPFPVVTR